jgi:hypothetical protein
MADTYTWGVANMERHLSDDVVYTVHWTVNAERTVGEDACSAGAYGSVGLGAPDPQAFIPYEDLTLEIVTNWVKESFGEEKVAEIEAALSQQLDQQENPTDAAGVPW